MVFIIEKQRVLYNGPVWRNQTFPICAEVSRNTASKVLDIERLWKICLIRNMIELNILSGNSPQNDIKHAKATVKLLSNI